MVARMKRIERENKTTAAAAAALISFSMNQTVHDDSCSTSIMCIKPGGTQNKTAMNLQRKKCTAFWRDTDAVTYIQFVTITSNALNSASASMFRGKNPRFQETYQMEMHYNISFSFLLFSHLWFERMTNSINDVKSTHTHCRVYGMSISIPLAKISFCDKDHTMCIHMRHISNANSSLLNANEMN